jgi:para-nitrobenzyl esterase
MAHPSRRPVTTLRFALIALVLTAAGVIAVESPAAATTERSHGDPVVDIDGGSVRGLAIDGGMSYRGLPYAATPTGELRWQPPQPVESWEGVRDATTYAPGCPQPPGPFVAEVTDEDCLFLNVTTPDVGHGLGGHGLRRHGRVRDDRPVLVWIHGGGFTQDAGSHYDPGKLAAEGVVVVTIDYRLGALGFLSHPALASEPGGPTGNYGLMDQQAALRWVQRNIGAFGGDPGNVTIAGESAGGLAVLAHLVSPGSRDLFQRAIVQSGAFALTQQPLVDAEAAGEAFAAAAGCPDQTAECLRALPVADLVARFPGSAIPGVVDGAVLTESIGAALAAGRFAPVPILDGTNHDEERLFVALGVTVSGGTFVPIPEPVTPDSYQRVIAEVLGVPDARAEAIAAEYPLDTDTSPTVTFSTLVADANFACPALQVDRWTAQLAPTFAYELNDDAAPPRFAPLDPPVATHTSELAYLFDLPNAPLQVPFEPDQEALAAAMRTAWATFAATGDPSTDALPWPRLDDDAPVMSLVPPLPQVETDFASAHHCSFWDAE